MESNMQLDNEITIQEASKMIDVSTKTIYNYIKKGLLRSRKWNGIWLLDRTVLMELNWKLNRTKKEFKSSRVARFNQHHTSFWVDKAHYEELLRQVGQLKAAENLLMQYKAQNQSLLERNKGLEKEIEWLKREAGKAGFWKRLRRGVRTGIQDEK